MKQRLEVERKAYSCCYIHDVQYKHTSPFPGKSGSDAMKRCLSLQILLPRPTDRSAPHNPFPMVVYLSGGGWRSPQVHFRLPLLTRLAEQGILVAMAEYRGCELFTCEDAAEDAACAVNYMYSHAEEYGGDPEKIFLMGDSAGAHLSMLTAYTGKVSEKISGVIELFGPSDLVRGVKELEDETVPLELKNLMMGFFSLIGKSQNQEILKERLKSLSILPYISKEAKIPSTLIAHGEEDRMVPIWHGDLLYETLIQAEKDVEYYCLKDAGHGDSRFFGDEMVSRYVEFIRRVTS